MVIANTSPSYLEVSDTNFKNIKENLKTFLKNSPDFSDYNFESSAISVLLDVLAYNTYHQSMYLNFNTNETFLDSAILRSNIVSRAKELNYIPKSAKSSKANITITIVPEDSPQEIIIPQYTKFSTTVDNINYTFTNDSEYIVTSGVNGVFTKSMDIYEGDVLKYTYIFDGTNYRYKIENPNLDISSLRVFVYDSASSTNKVEYTFYDDITLIDNSSTVYFVEENVDENYEIFFGDGVLGAKLEIGQKIEIYARFCNPLETDDISVFYPTSNVGYNKAQPNTLYPAASVTTNENSSGSQTKEEEESIRFLAPKFYQMQNRLVTEEDYTAFILSNWRNLDAVSVWGGEKNNPPYYGKTLLSVKPTNGFTIPISQKLDISKQILKKSVLSIDPLIVDPVFTFINTNINIDYDPRSTSLNVDQLYNNVSTNIKNYEKSYLGNFKKGFSLSKFSTLIDDTDDSILNTDITMSLEKRILPVLNSQITYSISFNSSLKHTYQGYLGTIKSNGFKTSLYPNAMCYLDDDGMGNLRLYTLDKITKTYLSNVGTVDYSTGQILLDSIIILSVEDGWNEVRIFAEPDKKLYQPLKNEIVLLSYPQISFFDITLNTISYTQIVDVDGNASPLYDNSIFVPIVR